LVAQVKLPDVVGIRRYKVDLTVGRQHASIVLAFARNFGVDVDDVKGACSRVQLPDAGGGGGGGGGGLYS